METDKSGIIGVVTPREDINAMKELYRAEYKKINDKENKANSNFNANMWRIRFGTFATQIGLLFQPFGTRRCVSHLAASALSFITKKVLKWKNNYDRKKYQKRKDQLTAEFINADGIFKEFSVGNPTTIEKFDEGGESKKLSA